MSNTCMQEFAHRFKQLRINSGYTQQQLANLFNVARPCICYWETGKRMPEYVTLLKICEFFGVSSDYLLGFSNSKTPTLQEGDATNNSDDYIYIAALSEEHKREIKDFYSYLLDKQLKFEKEQNSK